MFMEFGVLCLSACVLLFGMALIGARNPHPPRWAGDFWIGSVFVPMVILLAILGFTFFFYGIRDFRVNGKSLLDVAFAVATVVASAVVWRLMNVRKKIAAFEATPRATIHPIGDDQNVEPPGPSCTKAAA